MKHKTWQERFEEVLEFKQRYKRLPLTGRPHYGIEGTLGSWLTTQKKAYKGSKLTENQIKLLESIGIIWDTKKENEKKWDEKFNKLLEFRKKNPNGWPSRSSKKREERNLSLWCTYNKSWKEGRLKKYGEYPKEREQKLDLIGFWTSDRNRTVNNEKWNKKFNQLVEFRTKNPNRWPRSYAKDKEEKSLGKWCKKNKEWKKGYIKNYGEYPKEREEKLNSIGFIQHSNKNEKWLKRYEELKEFLGTNPDRWPSMKENKKLWWWVYRQRLLFQKGKLSKERIDFLNQINFEWHSEHK